MGSLRSSSDCTGMTVEPVTLGVPTFTDAIQENADPILFVWDDSRLPSGVIEDNGTITPDATEDDL